MGKAYKILREMNKDLKEKGVLTIARKIPVEYFKEKCLKSLAPKSLKQKLEETKREVMKQNRQKKIRQQDLQKEDTHWR